MNKLTNLISAALLTITVNAFAGDCPALNGDYKIGKKEDADFSTITEAINALKCGGVSGPVTFRIEDGTYNEKLTFSTINGADAFNNVKFEAASGNNSDVVITNSGSDATVTLNGTQWLTLENITISHKDAAQGNSIRVNGKASNLTFKGVVFDGIETTKTGDNYAVVYFDASASKNNITIEDCEVNNGSIGIIKTGMGTDVLDSKTAIIGTIFFNQYEAGLVLKNEDAPNVSNNVISSLSTYEQFKGAGFENVANSLLVSNNIINAANGAYGVTMTNCVAQPTNYGQIVNNSVAVGGNKTTGIYMAGSTDNQVLNFNRVKLTIQGQQNKDQAYYRNAGAGNNINLSNNIFYDLNTGGYTIIGNTYKDHFNQLPGQSNPTLNVSANGLMVEKVVPVK
jgi:hypothetical protein